MKIDLDRLYLEAQNHQGEAFTKLEFYKKVFGDFGSDHLLYKKAHDLKKSRRPNPVYVNNLMQLCGCMYCELFFSVE